MLKNLGLFNTSPESGTDLLGDAGAHDAAELVAGLLGGDAVDGKSAFNIVDEAEVLVGFLDGDHVHETGREVNVGSHFTINLHQSLKKKSKIQPYVRNGDFDTQKFALKRNRTMTIICFNGNKNTLSFFLTPILVQSSCQPCS